MEFEVRVVGGIESCYVSLPLSLIQTLQSGYLPPILAVELRSGANLWHVAWSGSLSSSSPSSIEVSLVHNSVIYLVSFLIYGRGDIYIFWLQIAKQYAECIGLSDRTVVKVRIVSNLLKATLVTVEPLTEDDWEIVELNSELAEEVILKQVFAQLCMFGQALSLKNLLISLLARKRLSSKINGPFFFNYNKLDYL